MRNAVKQTTVLILTWVMLLVPLQSVLHSCCSTPPPPPPDELLLLHSSSCAYACVFTRDCIAPGSLMPSGIAFGWGNPPLHT